jgi:hypothetical protein
MYRSTYEDVQVRKLKSKLSASLHLQFNKRRTSVGCVTCNGTWRWAMFATDQLQAHRSERALNYGGIGRERSIKPNAQLRRRAIGNERKW